MGHRRPRHAERRNLDHVGPFFIVEHEAGVGHSPQHELAAGNLHVSRPRTGIRCNAGLPAPVGRRISQRLAGVGKSFAVHFLVERRQLREIPQKPGRALPVDALQHSIQDPLQISQGSIDIRQRQVPARRVRHRGRIVEIVCIGEHRRFKFAIFPIAQAPVFLKPAEVADFPQRRIDNAEPGPQQPFAVQIPR